ncbi:MAG: HlyD family secretion protein, partial [Nitrososphaerales archaeon]
EQGVDVSLPPEMGGGSRHVDAPADKLAEARLQWNLKSQAAWEAHAQQAAALAARDAARQAFADLRGQKAQPVTLEGQAQAAEAAAQVADAAVEAAKAALQLVQAGATAEQVGVADATVAQAAASRQVLEAKRPQYTVLAPGSGTVTEVVLHEGEVAAAGAPIARLSATGVVSLTVYVPASRLGEVRLGGPVAVGVDAFPQRTFGGTVTKVAGEAEFTPKNVQTREERAGTVFAVKVSLPNANAALKAGMPADAFFCPSSTACDYPYETLARASAGTVSNLVARVLPQPSPTVTAQPAVSAAYAGSLEATSVRVASEMGGRVARVLAAEGDRVSAGQVLFTVAGEELAAQRAEADAAVSVAKAELSRIEAKPQPERIAQAEANVKQAEAAVAAAKARLAAADAERKQPQELNSQVNSARQQIDVATAAVDAARAQVKTAQVLQESLQYPGSDEDKTRRAGYDAQATAAAARLRAVEAQLAGAKAVLARLLAIRANPVALDGAVHKAQGEVAIAEAGLATARAAAAQVSAAPQAEAVAVARARVAEAAAGRDAVDAALAKLEVRSPIDGEVTVQAIHTGEVVNAGAPLYTVADLAQLRLTVYVPLDQVGGVRVGQAAQVTVDSDPGRSYAGTVTRLADQAEYTPKNVQTAEERARMVIPVEVTLPNVDGSLRPGMGAEARW